jgi:cation transport regulator ChaB
MAALDGLADKVFNLRMKQYGDKNKEQKVIDQRVETAHVISSMLVRDITLR